MKECLLVLHNLHLKPLSFLLTFFPSMVPICSLFLVRFLLVFENFETQATTCAIVLIDLLVSIRVVLASLIRLKAKLTPISLAVLFAKEACQFVKNLSASSG